MTAAAVTEIRKPPATPQPGAPHVLIAISDVMADVAKEGISKSRSNTTQNYKFRGIDDVYNALAPILAKHKLVITPSCQSRSKEVVATKGGGSLFYVTVDMEFELASAVDGSTKTARMFGEAMDSGDKATNKAMSAAYKYMAMQEFCIPTEGDNDTDQTTHQLASAEETALRHLRSCAIDGPTFKAAWEKNKGPWRELLEPAAYARVVATMKELGAQFASPAKTAPPSRATSDERAEYGHSDPFGGGDIEIDDDEIPGFD